MLPALRRFLTAHRLSYAWLAGGVLWGAWLASLLLGSGNVDLAGQPVGTDYLQFYAAGITVRSGDGAKLYDMAYQAQIEKDIIGPRLSTYHAFITPPFLSWVFVPLSRLPYKLSFIVWSLLGLLLLAASLVLLGDPHPKRSYLLSLTWFPVFAAVAFGQNALLTVFILSVAYGLWRRGHIFLAGLVLSLITYKPQLVLGFALWWAVDVRKSWRAMLGLALGTGALVAFCFYGMPEASAAYVKFALTVLPDLPSWQDFPIWHLHTVRGFWRLLCPWSPKLGDALTLVLDGAIVWYGARLLCRYREHPTIPYATAVCLSICLTPHAMAYDWALLVIPGVLLYTQGPEQRERWRPLWALVWVAVFLSGPLTHLQLRTVSAALQVSVPVLGFVLISLYHDLMTSTSERGDLCFRPSGL